MDKPVISVIIPVKNGAATLERCLLSIRKQTVDQIEIIVLDSASTDDSKLLAKNFNTIIVDISPVEFDHGLTRNHGIQLASADLVYLTVQDAWIPDTQMLEKMAKHFEDPEVMAVTGHQAVAHEKDKNPLMWYHSYSEPEVSVRQIKDIEAFKALPQTEQQKLVAWDNVVAMYRRQALIELPFVQTEMSEDWMWSYQALLKGWKLLRDPSLIVYHYHHHTYDYTFNTNYSINYHFYKFFGYRPGLPPVWIPTMKAAWHIFRNKELTLREKVYWIWHNYRIQAATLHSNKDFLRRLHEGGEKALEEGYKMYCARIPQGRQMHFRRER